MIDLVVTTAGKQALINAQHTGTNKVTLSHIGVGSGKYTPTEGRTSLQAEIKRLAIIEGGSAGDSALHVAFLDDSDASYTVYEIGVYTSDGTLFALTSSQTVIAEKTNAASLLLAIDLSISGLDVTSVSFGDLTYSNAAGTTENAGVLAVATNAEAAAGVATQKAIVPSNLSHVLTERTASNAEVQAGTNGTKFVTPATLAACTATTGRAGVIALASDEEAIAGKDNVKAITSLGVQQALSAYTGQANGLKVTATASTTPRALSARFADIICPKDFGAKGDGTADDTAAFTALEAAYKGRDIDLGGAVYVVSARPTGNNYHNGSFSVGGVAQKAVYDFFKYGGTAPDAVCVRRDFSESSRGGGALLAADWVRSGTSAGAVVQAAVWDEANRYLYTLHTTSGDLGVVNRFSGMKLGGAVVNASTAYTTASQYIGHQGLGIQYMDGGAVKLWASMTYTAAGSTIASKGTKAVRFSAPSTNDQSIDDSAEVFNLFPAVENSSQATTVCTSYSGKYLIAKLNESGNTYWIRLFKLADLTTAGDYSNKFIHEFRIDLTRDTTSGASRALQGMACDDRNIYFLAAAYGYSEKHSLYVTDMFGNVVDEYRDLSVGKEIGRSVGTTYYEPQSLFFMSLNGALTLVLQVATGDSTGKRLCHLIALNTRRSYYFPTGNGTGSYHGVAIDEQARIVNADGRDNMSFYPSGQATYLQARAGVNQVSLARFSNDSAGNSIVFMKSRGASIGSSVSATAGDAIGQIQFLVDNGNIDYAGTVQGARAGYISGEVFESSTLTTAGTTNLGVRGVVRIYACSDAAGREGKGIEVIDNGLRPTDDDALNLGTAGRRWKTVYATTDTISTSDARDKRDIGAIPDAVLDAWASVEFKQYRLKDDDKYYFGVVAQDIISAFEAEGLDPFKYGIICEDTLDNGEKRFSVRYRDIMILEAALNRRGR